MKSFRSEPLVPATASGMSTRSSQLWLPDAQPRPSCATLFSVPEEKHAC